MPLPLTSRVAIALGCALAALSPASADDAQQPAAIEAGRKLYFDVQLSEPPGTACASCHDPARAFTGDNGSGSAVARGSRPLGYRYVAATTAVVLSMLYLGLEVRTLYHGAILTRGVTSDVGHSSDTAGPRAHMIRRGPRRSSAIHPHRRAASRPTSAASASPAPKRDAVQNTPLRFLPSASSHSGSTAKETCVPRTEPENPADVANADAPTVRPNTAPSEFVWRGRRYRVRAMEAARDGSPISGNSLRRFRVRTTNGLSCVLSQEVPGGAWRLDRLVSAGGGR